MYFSKNFLLFLFCVVLFVNSIRANDCFIRFDVKNVDKNVKSYSVLVNARKFLSVNDYKTSIDGSVSLHLPISSLFISDGNHSIAVYAFNSTLSLIDLQNVFISSHEYNNCKNEVNENIIPVPFEDQGHSIGVQYSVWHGYGSTAINKMKQLGAEVKTIEKIIELGETIGDYWSHGVKEMDSDNSYYMVEPKMGFYCFYRKRDNENTSIIPDCEHIPTNLELQAQMLTTSGVDYVYVDATNLCNESPEEDVIQRRPIEVMFEEWHKLRAQGKQTPQIVVWHRIDLRQCTTWREYLNLYDQYPDLVWKDSKTGKKVFMATEKSDSDLKQQIEANGGKNDVIVVNNWVAWVQEAHAGRWQFMGRCGGETGKDSSDVVNLDSCEQSVSMSCLVFRPETLRLGTRSRPVFPIVSNKGDQGGMSCLYELSTEMLYTSTPWGSSTSFYGLTFLLQWVTAFRVNPQHITISGWNEFFAGAQTNPFGGYVHSVGLKPTDNRLFVDLYGAYRSRNIEPTVEYGNLFYDLMQSCLRVRKINLKMNANNCSVDEEICCQLNRLKQFVEIHSLFRKDNKDFILVNSQKEREILLSTNYNEICVIGTNTHDFCSDANPSDANSGVSGAFIMYDRDGENRKALYRCRIDDRHFFSEDSKCEKQETDHLIGYMSTKKDSQFARSLTRCVNSENIHYHALDGDCHPGDITEFILGYVI